MASPNFFPSIRRQLLAAALTVLLPGPADAQPTTTRMNVGPGDTEANNAIPTRQRAAINADGRFVVFNSSATNLVADDTNGRADVFVRDRETNTTTRISVGPGGVQGNGDSGGAAISADGRWVAFHSAATNLVAGDTNGVDDVFVHDRDTGATMLVSVGADGTQSSDFSRNPAISGDGRSIAFQSWASNLVAGDTNASTDIFVHDRQTGVTTRASVATDGTQANDFSSEPVLSADGRFVAFQTLATNLAVSDVNGTEDVFVHDRQTGTTTRVNEGPGGIQGFGAAVAPSLSADGRWIAFPSEAGNLVAGDTNFRWDVFVRDMQTGAVTRVSVGPGGTQAPPSPDDPISYPTISADGRWIAFDSSFTHLVADDTNDHVDVFLHDRQAGTTTRIGLGPGDAQGNDNSWSPIISADGRVIVFESAASNLVADDTNDKWDVFAYDRGDTGCAATLAPGVAIAPAAGLSGSLVVLTSAGCAWTAASNDADWLAVTSGANGAGVGSVSYNVAANTGASRTGSLTIAGMTFTVTQAPPVCTFAVDQISISLAAAATLGDVAVTAPGGCPWSAVSSDSSWLRVFAGAGGTGAGTVSYHATHNPLSIGRSGTLSIAGHVITVTQTGYFGTTTRVMGGLDAFSDPKFPVISADGRWVAFESHSTDLVDNDTNGHDDVFLHDRQTGLTTRVNVASDGTQANSQTLTPAISADGRYVAFASAASNLVAGDTNESIDVFVHDRDTKTTTRVSVGPGGAQRDANSSYPNISADGRWVTYMSGVSPVVAPEYFGQGQIFVHDRHTGTTEIASIASGGEAGKNSSLRSAISPDGRFVAFESIAHNLVPGDTNNTWDVFVHDRQTRMTTRVSVSSGGVQANGASRRLALSANGRVVAFESSASNLVQGDTNGWDDVFVHDRETGTTARVSVGPGGVQGTYHAGNPTISADGRWVTFEAVQHDLGPADTNLSWDVYIYDRQTGAITRASLGPGGAQGNHHSLSGSISADGRSVVFDSSATNLVGDAAGAGVFVHERHDVPCGFTLSPTSRTTPAGGATSTAIVLSSAECAWTAVSDDPSWLTITSGSSGAGFGVVSFTVAANAEAANRIGTLSIAGRTLTVHQSSSTATATPPTTTPDDYATAFNTSLVIPAPGVLVNDVSHGGGVMTAVLVGATANGSVSLDASGAFTYTPSPGFSGTDTFSYRAVTSSGAGNVATVSIVVTDAATPPPPTGLFVQSIAGNLVTVRWTILPGGPTPTGFELEGGVNPGEVLASLATGSLAPTFTFVAPSGSFYVRMHTVSGAIRSTASNEVRVHVNVPVAPSAPANLLALVDGSTLALAWTNTYAGGAPTSFVLDVTGAIDTSLPLGVGDSLVFAGVPAGSYTLTLRAQNAAGLSPSSNAVTVTFPGPCSGPPAMPRDVVAFRVGNTVFVDWAPGTGGPAPTSYVLEVSGSFVGTFPTAARALNGTVGPGSYTLSVVAVNGCGVSAATAPQTIVVP